jgi:hypothetical protein
MAAARQLAAQFHVFADGESLQGDSFKLQMDSVVDLVVSIPECEDGTGGCTEGQATRRLRDAEV